MQTMILSIQPGSGATTQQRNAATARGDGAQFSAMLSSEMTPRQQPAPPAAALAVQGAPKQQAPAAQAADKPVRPDDAAKPRPATQVPRTDAQEGGDDADKDPAADASAASADPASAMLALMASLQTAQEPKAPGAKAMNQGQADDALAGAAGKGKRADAAQLATLQAAMKSAAGKTGAAADPGRFTDSAATENPALAAAGAKLGTDDQSAAATGATPREALAAFAAKADARLQADSLESDAALARASAASRVPQAATDAALAALSQVQPAMLQAAQAAAAGDRLGARVGTTAWESQVGQKIVYMAGSEDLSASLTLNPPDLGPLQVVLSVSNDQASVTFSSNQLEVRQALENALPRLREMMSENGIALGNASVNAGMPDGRQAQEQAARSQRGSGSGTRGRGDADGGAIADTATRRPSRTAVLGDRGMVDTFA